MTGKAIKGDFPREAMRSSRCRFPRAPDTRPVPLSLHSGPVNETDTVSDDAQTIRIATREWRGCLHFIGPLGIVGRTDRLIRRKTTITAATATQPYSSSITQLGSDPHGRPSVRKCHWTYVEIMLTVQIMISSAEGDVRNGRRQRKYHGNTTGAHKRDAAIGKANTSGDHSGAVILSQVAVTNPTSTASPARNCGGAT